MEELAGGGAGGSVYANGDGDGARNYWVRAGMRMVRARALSISLSISRSLSLSRSLCRLPSPKKIARERDGGARAGPGTGWPG